MGGAKDPNPRTMWFHETSKTLIHQANTMTFILRKNFQRTMLCLLVFLSISSAVAWWNVSGPTVERPRPDMVHYMALAEGVPLAGVPAPFRYRPWTSWLAAQIPDPPQAWLDSGRPLDSQRSHFRFAVVNVAGLTLAAAGLCLLTMRLLGSSNAGTVAGLIFLTSFHPLTTATLPMAEAWSYAFLIWALWLLLDRKHLALGLVFLLGLSCKETILLVLPAAVLLGSSRKQRVRQGAALLPVALLYVTWRCVWWPPPEALFSIASTQEWLRDLLVAGKWFPGNAARAFMAFHLFWVPAAMAWWGRRREAGPLTRWAWLVPPILAVPFVLALVPGRVWFFAFPFVIPLAVAGLWDWLRRPKLCLGVRIPSD